MITNAIFGLASILAGCHLVSLVNGLSPISVKGTKLYDGDGKQFFVKGVAYARGVNNLDVLVDTAQCQIDAGLMKTLGVNTARVYTVDNTANHDGCMQAFAAQGIFIWLDITTPLVSFQRTNPAWTMDMYTNWTATIDAFSGYDNLLSFTVGNEVMNENVDSTLAAPYVKAAVRDIKAFRDARGYRSIPISYTSADVKSLRQVSADYFACGDSEDTVDMYGMNVYSWCGNSSYYASGFDTIYEEFQSIDVPVVFSETGCIQDGRDFSDVSTMLGPVFQAVFSGAIVYEWTMEESGYGIVDYSNTAYKGFPTTLSDYNVLKTVLSTATPAGTSMTAYTPSNVAPACPTLNSSAWLVDGDVALPTIARLELSTVTARTTITSATSTSTKTRSASAGANTETSLGSGNDPNISSNSSPGLSTGAIAGIAVGGVVLVIAAILGVFFTMRRRSRTMQRRQEIVDGGMTQIFKDADGNDTSEPFKSELPAISAARIIPRQELDAAQNWQGGHAQSADPNHGGHRPEAEDNTAVRRQSMAYEMEANEPMLNHTQNHEQPQHREH